MTSAPAAMYSRWIAPIRSGRRLDELVERRPLGHAAAEQQRAHRAVEQQRARARRSAKSLRACEDCWSVTHREYRASVLRSPDSTQTAVPSNNGASRGDGAVQQPGAGAVVDERVERPRVWTPWKPCTMARETPRSR